ncbi:hypothetical protein D6D06_06688 [Aureobasidium pullulans]|nr:hypothetical protein D6D06_06688 [Aureobasidium pullulans]THY84840.1 hypothetical protein D6C95_08046 [Aureobasidium pullulans]TIA09854.1 hypothetical protein D6C80_08375 [Aureobasidium pullulans]
MKLLSLVTMAACMVAPVMSMPIADESKPADGTSEVLIAFEDLVHTTSADAMHVLDVFANITKFDIESYDKTLEILASDFSQTITAIDHIVEDIAKAAIPLSADNAKILANGFQTIQAVTANVTAAFDHLLNTEKGIADEIHEDISRTLDLTSQLVGVFVKAAPSILSYLATTATIYADVAQLLTDFSMIAAPLTAIAVKVLGLIALIV